MNKLQKKELNHLKENKNKIYCMFILHQLKLMTSYGFVILLILFEMDWEEILHNLGKVFNESPVEFWNETNELIL